MPGVERLSPGWATCQMPSRVQIPYPTLSLLRLLFLRYLWRRKAWARHSSGAVPSHSCWRTSVECCSGRRTVSRTLCAARSSSFFCPPSPQAWHGPPLSVPVEPQETAPRPTAAVLRPNISPFSVPGLGVPEARAGSHGQLPHDEREKCSARLGVLRVEPFDYLYIYIYTSIYIYICLPPPSTFELPLQCMICLSRTGRNDLSTRTRTK